MNQQPQETIYVLQFNREWLDTLRDLMKKVSGMNADEAQKYTTLYAAITKSAITADDYQRQLIQQYEASKQAQQAQQPSVPASPVDSPVDPDKVN